MARLDPHSYADSEQPQTRSLELHAVVDFAARVVRSEVVLHFREAAPSGPIDLDTRDLDIDTVVGLEGEPLAWELASPDTILGSRLRIALPSGTLGIRIRCASSPQAMALQWLDAAQTASGKPFLFTQCQPIHARSIIPLQDTPRVRITIDKARFEVPPELRALMAGAAIDRSTFAMPQPIPPYLFAFAVGDLVERPVSSRCSVWAERPIADAAAFELGDVEKTLQAAEGLFGPYDWDRADLLVMPPSFPYGGMENPRLTFVTPSLLAGDKSLVNVIAHELAHAWTGNLVTNANANHFWLNEGFTVYAERRILEAMHGRETSELHAAIGRHDLEEALKRFAKRPELTSLRTELKGQHPDEAYSSVPYEKGYFFLRRLEELAGRDAWDGFLRTYLKRFRFQSIDTNDFLRTLNELLPGLAAKADAAAWVDGPGLPPDAPVPQSSKLTELQELARAGTLPGMLAPTELLVYLQALPQPADVKLLAALDAQFGLSMRKSLELRSTFVLAQLRAGLPDAIAGMRRVVSETGRMKYLKPLYAELAKRDVDAARTVYADYRAGYHPIAREVIEPMLY
ncbi:MAG TPA: M1 family metallopeptidase [Myxococcales bacterium]|nr:M1 family metallopeptidase [Myxococcales bacterium]